MAQAGVLFNEAAMTLASRSPFPSIGQTRHRLDLAVGSSDCWHRMPCCLLLVLWGSVTDICAETIRYIPGPGDLISRQMQISAKKRDFPPKIRERARDRSLVAKFDGHMWCLSSSPQVPLRRGPMWLIKAPRREAEWGQASKIHRITSPCPSPSGVRWQKGW
jgi:hypothetical protein